MIKKVDDLVGYLDQALTSSGLVQDTDVIIVSDHGMLTVTPQNFIDLDQYLDKQNCKIYQSSPVWEHFFLLTFSLAFLHTFRCCARILWDKKSAKRNDSFSVFFSANRLILLTNAFYLTIYCYYRLCKWFVHRELTTEIVKGWMQLVDKWMHLKHIRTSICQTAGALRIEELDHVQSLPNRATPLGTCGKRLMAPVKKLVFQVLLI